MSFCPGWFESTGTCLYELRFGPAVVDHDNDLLSRMRVHVLPREVHNRIFLDSSKAFSYKANTKND